MATSWPLIEAMRRCAYVPFYDTDGDVIKCNCCQQEEEELTKKDLQEDWGGCLRMCALQVIHMPGVLEYRLQRRARHAG